MLCSHHLHGSAFGSYYRNDYLVLEMVLSCMIKTLFTLSSMSILIGLVVPLLLLSRTMGIASTEPPSSVLGCVETFLISRGESIFRIDKEKGIITTGFHWVGPEELRRIAVLDRGKGQIRWTKGIYQLIISSLSLSDEGKTQIQVNARIFGAGETSLPLMRPSLWWLLPSTGSLEGDILAALVIHCQVKP